MMSRLDLWLTRVLENWNSVIVGGDRLIDVLG